MRFMSKTYQSFQPIIENILIDVQPMSQPSGLLFYMDYLNDATAQQIADEIDREAIKDLINQKAREVRARYPHTCPRCNAAAYIGFNSVDCSAGCS